MKEEQETRVRCPYCQRLIEQDQIEQHIADKHREILD